MIHINKNNVLEMLKDSLIYLYGGGYTGRVIITLLQQKGLKTESIIDDDEGL